MPASSSSSRTEPPDSLRETPRWLLTALLFTEDIVYLGVALVLIGVAVAALYNTVHDLFASPSNFAQTVTAGVNGVLFVVIVLEIFRTVLAHLEGGGFQLRPFLIIGIISAVRHILLVGALSASNENREFNHAQIELGVNAGVALVLVIALVLLHRRGATSDLEDDDDD
jgi:uncharacterized membrane protein (DUF373 family)